MKRDPILGESTLRRGPLGQRLASLRGRLANDQEQMIDFDSVLQVKQDLYRQMGRSPDAASDLRPVYKALDEALEAASPAYRQANDTFAQQSRVIDAVDEGSRAASPRTRAPDNVQRFEGMNPDQQAAFRAGFGDRLLGRVEAASSSPTTNKARLLQTPKAEQELATFAGSRAPRLQRQIGREQTMFETANQALGGSRTADNLADAAEMASVDPSMISAVLSGSPRQMIVQALTRAGNMATGRNEAVRDRIAKALMETNPEMARRELSSAIERIVSAQMNQQAAIRALSGPAMTGAGQGY